MADGYLKYRLRQLGLEDKVCVSSAGTYASQGEESPLYARRAIAKYGANIDEHTASVLENVPMQAAEHVLVMTERHKKDVLNRYPILEGKVKLLGKYSKDKKYFEIDDPWGYSYEVYEKCAKEIVDSIEGFIDQEL